MCHERRAGRSAIFGQADDELRQRVAEAVAPELVGDAVGGVDRRAPSSSQLATGFTLFRSPASARVLVTVACNILVIIELVTY